MIAPIVAGAAKAAPYLLTLLSLLKRGGKGAAIAGKAVGRAGKSAYASPHFLEGLLGAGFIGGEALDQLGGVGERNLAREQLAIEKLLGETSAEARKKLLKESRKQTKEYMAEFAKTKREDAQRESDRALMEVFLNSMDRQAAISMQAIQGVSQVQANRPSAPAGMIDIMRSAF